MNNTSEKLSNDKYSSLFAEVVALGIEHSNHESDLYIPANDLTRQLALKYDIKGVHFLHQSGKSIWLDLPFQYTPFWEQKLGGEDKANVAAKLRSIYPLKDFGVIKNTENQVVVAFVQDEVFIHDPSISDDGRFIVDTMEVYGIQHEDADEMYRVNGITKADIKKPAFK